MAVELNFDELIDGFPERAGGEAPVILTIEEAAKELRCSKAHVQNLLAGKVSSARLPCIKLGRRKLIRRESLLRWLDHAELRA